jgi:hypothetical protein
MVRDGNEERDGIRQFLIHEWLFLISEIDLGF